MSSCFQIILAPDDTAAAIIAIYERAVDFVAGN
jgi:hypothetical protein